MPAPVTALARPLAWLEADTSDRRHRVVRRGFAVVIGLRLASGSFAALAEQPDAQLRTPLVVSWLDGVPSASVLVAVQVAGIVAAVAAALGWGTRVDAARGPVRRRLDAVVRAGALPAAWAALLFLTAVRTSGGKVLHNDVLLLLVALPVLLAPENRGRPRRNVGWTLNLAVVVLALAYALAAVAKLIHTGPSWVFSDNMRYVMYWSAQSPGPGWPWLAETIADNGALARLVAASIMGLELVAPIVVWPRARPLFAAGAVALHAGTWATLGIDYWGWALTAVVLLVDWGGGRRAAAHAGAASTGTLVHDGDCAFCTTTARWVARRAGGRAEVAPSQRLDLDALGLTAEQVQAEVWWVDPDGTRHGGHRAVARSLRAVGGPWRVVGWVLARRPVGLVAGPVYAWVARHRHRLPGGTPACRVEP